MFHDEKAPEPTLAYLLSRMSHPEFPEPIGVFRAVDAPRYEELMNEQIEKARKTRGPGDLQALFNSGETWTVEPSAGGGPGGAARNDGNHSIPSSPVGRKSVARRRSPAGGGTGRGGGGARVPGFSLSARGVEVGGAPMPPPQAHPPRARHIASAARGRLTGDQAPPLDRET